MGRAPLLDPVREPGRVRRDDDIASGKLLEQELVEASQQDGEPPAAVHLAHGVVVGNVLDPEEPLGHPQERLDLSERGPQVLSEEHRDQVGPLVDGWTAWPDAVLPRRERLGKCTQGLEGQDQLLGEPVVVGGPAVLLDVLSDAPGAEGTLPGKPQGLDDVSPLCGAAHVGASFARTPTAAPHLVVSVQIVKERRARYEEKIGFVVNAGDISSETYRGTFFYDDHEDTYHYATTVWEYAGALGQATCDADATVIQKAPAIGADPSNTYMHELGHNLGLNHVQSGSTAMRDNQNPDQPGSHRNQSGPFGHSRAHRPARGQG